MIKEVLWNKKTIYLATIIAVLLICIWGLASEQSATIEYSDTTDPWTDGWIQITEEGEMALSDIGEFETLSTAGTLIFENEIPELIEDQVLLFYSKDLEIKVFVGEELIYSFEMQERFEFLDTPGNTWNKIDIPVELSGETIRIELSSNFINRYMATVTELYLIDMYEVKIIIVQESWPQIFMSIILIGMTIDAFVNACIWKRKTTKEYFMRLSSISLWVCIWVLGMSGLLDYIFHKPIFSYLCSVITIPLLPIVVFRGLAAIYPQKVREYRWIENILWVDLVVQYILQFVFGISLLKLLPISIFIYVGGSIIILYVITQYIIDYVRHRQGYEELNIALVSLIIIFVGVIIECWINVFMPQMTNLIGLASITAFLIYLAFNKYLFSHFESKSDIEKEVLERSYNNLQNTTSVQQIQAHFFFNTLNTISALCKQDAEKADNAIRLFASYMRTFMHFINEQKNIAFVEEIKLIEGLLAIHRLRFPGKHTFNFHLEYTDFEVPPLSIQPLVENALLHGLKPVLTGGVLQISSHRIEDYVQIIIEDNGVGFDIANLDESERVGLANIRTRIRIMSQGTIRIESTEGEGTRAIVEIPLN